LLTTLVAVAPQLVPLVFGDEWRPAVFPTQVLALAGLGAVTAVGAAPLLLAAGRARPLLVYNVVLLVGYAGVVFWASGHGIRVVVIAVACYQVVLVAAQFVFLERGVVGIPLRETCASIAPALVSSGVSLAAAYVPARLLARAGVPAAVVVLAAGAIAAAIYVLALRLAFRSSWRELVHLARAFVGRDGVSRSSRGTGAQTAEPDAT
jgi:O-antigen/teichoic acid export membrane protein